MKLFKKAVLLLVSILIFSFGALGANAQADTEYTLICKKGMCFTEDTMISAGEYHAFAEEKSFITAKNSTAVIQLKTGIVDIAPYTRMTAGETLTLSEGAVGIVSNNGITAIQTPTETAYVSDGGKAAVRVDDYGNAFNYCIKGELKLVSTADKNEITLKEGEYIAVTVKRGIRILKDFSESDINEMNIEFTDPDTDISAGKTNAETMPVIEYDFGIDGEVSSLATNTVYHFKNISEDTVTRILYLNNGTDGVGFEIYNSALELIAEVAMGSSKSNTRITSDAQSEFYIYIYGTDGTQRKLFNERYISIYERSFNILKTLALPAVVAIVIFIIYGLIKSKKNTQSKPKF